MDASPFVKAANDMGNRFISLLDTLSAVTAVTAMDVRQKDTHILLREALEVLVQHQDLERSSIFLMEGDRLVFWAGTGSPPAMTANPDGVEPRFSDHGATVRLGEGLVGRAASTGEAQYLPDCSTDQMLGGPADSHSRGSGSVLCMPVTSGGAVLGVTAIHHPERDHFKDWHRHALSLFCGVIGHMLASHQVLQRMEEAVEQRTRQLEVALEEAQLLKQRYEELSSVDALTGLHNRRFFYPEAEAAVSGAIRYRHDLCVVLVDLDQFKGVNDKYGHAAGDSVLCSVAEALRHYTREGDILARIGGEEFVLALPFTSIIGARTLAERIRTSVDALRWPEMSRRMRCTASIGIACLNETVEGDARQRLERLMRNADQAMYRCKREGRNRVAVY